VFRKNLEDQVLYLNLDYNRREETFAPNLKGERRLRVLYARDRDDGVCGWIWGGSGQKDHKGKLRRECSLSKGALVECLWRVEVAGGNLIDTEERDERERQKEDPTVPRNSPSRAR